MVLLKEIEIGIVRTAGTGPGSKLLDVVLYLFLNFNKLTILSFIKSSYKFISLYKLRMVQF